MTGIRIKNKNLRTSELDTFDMENMGHTNSQLNTVSIIFFQRVWQLVLCKYKRRGLIQEYSTKLPLHIPPLQTAAAAADDAARLPRSWSRG